MRTSLWTHKDEVGIGQYGHDLLMTSCGLNRHAWPISSTLEISLILPHLECTIVLSRCTFKRNPNINQGDGVIEKEARDVSFAVILVISFAPIQIIIEGKTELTSEELCPSYTQAVHLPALQLSRVEGTGNLFNIAVPVQKFNTLGQMLGISYGRGKEVLQLPPFQEAIAMHGTKDC